MMPSARIKAAFPTSMLVHDNQITPESTGSLILLLQHFLPKSLTVIRRLQSLSRKPRPTSHILTTFPVDAVASPDESHPFAVALCDHANPSGIHVYAFSSAEAGDEVKPSTSHVTPLVELLAHYHRVPHVPFVVLAGSTHERTAALLRRSNVVRDDLFGPGGPYVRIVLSADRVIASAAAQTRGGKPMLSDDLMLDVVRSRDHARIMACNSLVRSPDSMESWRSAAVRLAGASSESSHASQDNAVNALRLASGDAVAWVFLDESGSLRTLHVEAAYRRRGLARLLVSSLVAEALNDGVFDVPGASPDSRLLSASAAKENTASIALFTSLGGSMAWDEYWLRVDLARCAEFSGSRS